MISKRALITLLLAGALAVTPALAAAQVAGPPASDDATQTTLGPGQVGDDTWLGALAAIGCGFMVKATIATAGTQVGTIAGAVACCGYALFDAIVVEPTSR